MGYTNGEFPQNSDNPFSIWFYEMVSSDIVSQRSTGNARSSSKVVYTVTDNTLKLSLKSQETSIYDVFISPDESQIFNVENSVYPYVVFG